jgi:hypothetical protein
MESDKTRDGGMAERFKAAVLKSELSYPASFSFKSKSSYRSMICDPFPSCLVPSNFTGFDPVVVTK